LFVKSDHLRSTSRTSRSAKVTDDNKTNLLWQAEAFVKVIQDHSRSLMIMMQF